MTSKVLKPKVPGRGQDAEIPRDEKTSKQNLIDAAVKIFGEKGFDGATVKDIAVAAHANIAMISYYFESKEGLYRACIEGLVQKRVGLAKRILTPAESPADFQRKLRTWMDEFLKMNLNDPNESGIIHRELELSPESSKRVLKNVFHEIWFAVTTFFQGAQSSKFLRQDIDIEVAAATVMGTMGHLIKMDRIIKEMVGKSLQDEPVRTHFIHNFLEVYLNGLLGRSK